MYHKINLFSQIQVRHFFIIFLTECFSIISGLWRQGKRNGEGRYWFANNDSCLQGVWVDDIFKSGTYVLKSAMAA